MKKFLWFSFLLGFVFLGGCATNTPITSKVSSDVISQNDLFKKKQECLKYSDDMLIFAKKYHSAIYELEEVFYSPIKDSCYFIAKEWVLQRIVFDYLNQKAVLDLWFWPNCFEYQGEEKIQCFNDETHTRIEYDNEIKKLKWE